MYKILLLILISLALCLQCVYEAKPFVYVFNIYNYSKTKITVKSIERYYETINKNDTIQPNSYYQCKFYLHECYNSNLNDSLLLFFYDSLSLYYTNGLKININALDRKNWKEELHFENDSYFLNNDCKKGKVIYKLFIY